MAFTSFPATSNALVVRHLVIHQASADVVLGFIGRAGRHPPNDDPDSIAGVASWALSLHGTKLLRVTDKSLTEQFEIYLVPKEVDIRHHRQGVAKP